MTPCPHVSACWLSGNYNYCKVSHCHEPLLPKDKPIHESVGKNTRKVIEATGSGIVVSPVGMDYELTESAMVENDGIQGELF